MSLQERDAERVRITILHDTGAKYSIVRNGVLPFSNRSYCGSDWLAWGIGLSILRIPVHTVHLECQLVSGPVRVGVRDQMPVPGVDLILGNDLAGTEVFPKIPEFTEIPTTHTCVYSPPNSTLDFSACVVTRARACKLGEQSVRSSKRPD